MNEHQIIFLVENSTDYVFLLEQAFRRADVTNPIKIARYGNEAILYLKGVGIYSDRTHYPLPHVIVIDMSLTDGSALSVVGWIRRQAQFSSIPVIVLVTGPEKQQVQAALDRGANAYFVKRDDLAELAQMIKAIEHVEQENPGQLPEAEEESSNTHAWLKHYWD
jgi:DNA-binding response OmpR family regulator